MRLFLTASTSVLVAATLVCGASAQSRPGWVDPPARSGPKEAAPEKASPKAEAPEKAPAKVADETPPTARSGIRHEPAPEAHKVRRAAQAPRSRPRTAEIRRERRMRVREEAVYAAPAPQSAPAADARFDEWAPAAQRLTEAYLDTVSGSGAAMVASAPRFYAGRVSFYGRSVSLASLIADKSRFVRRWPERRYEAQGMRTACNAATATCVVRTTVTFTAVNPSRGVRSHGVTELAFTISFADGRPVIVGETGQVVRRGGPSLGALARPARST